MLQTSAKEEAFLASLRQAWQLGGNTASAAVITATAPAPTTPPTFERDAQTIAEAPLRTAAPEGAVPAAIGSGLVPYPTAVDTPAQRS